MTKMLFRNWLIICISVGTMGAGIAWACSGDWDAEYGTSNFTPEVFVKNEYSPFFYSQLFYYKIGHDEEQNTRFNEVNVTDWSAWLNHQIPEKTIAFLLQAASSRSIDSAYLYASGKSAKVPPFMQGFSSPGNKMEKLSQFLNYLRLAKTSEEFAVNDIQFEWNYDSAKKNKKYNTAALNDELKKGFTGMKDAFLKERYWYQLTRSYFYNGDFKNLTSIFETYETGMPRNSLYWRTLAYVAGGYYRNRQFSRANYYYSLVYDHSDILKTTAHYSFHPQEEKDWKETLALCKDGSEQATLWQMLGVFYSDETRSISEIYKIDSKSAKINLLLARAINKYEQRFNESEKVEVQKRDTNNIYEDSLKRVITKIAKAGNTEKPWIWNLAAGYINTLDRRYGTAEEFYGLAAKTLPPDKLPNEQLRLLRLINRIGAVTKIDSKFEEQNLPDIRWLAGLDKSDIAVFRSADALKWLEETFAAHYRDQGESAKAQCFVSKPSFYADLKKNVEDMKSFLDKPSKTPFEQFCVSISAIQLSDIYEYESIRLAYKDSIDAAILKMNMAGKAEGSILAGNPFNARINDCHDCDFAAPQKIKYSKLAFLEKMKLLKTKIANGEDAFTNSLLLANAFYNISEFGNARLFYECKIIGESHSTPYMIEDDYRPLLISMDIATKYYELTLSLAKTEEQKAKCQYLLAKCQRNQWYNLNIYNKPEDYNNEKDMVNLSALQGFSELRKYPGTQYYKEVLRECGYFKTFMDRNPPLKKN